MEMPEEYSEKFKYNIGDLVTMIGLEGEVFEVISYNVVNSYGESHFSITFTYTLGSIDSGHIEESIGDNLLPFDGDIDDAVTDISENEVNNEEYNPSINDLLDYYNHFKKLYNNTNLPIFKDKMDSVVDELNNIKC